MPKKRVAASAAADSSSSNFLSPQPTKRHKAAKSAFMLWKTDAKKAEKFTALAAKEFNAIAKAEFAQLSDEDQLKYSQAASEEKARVAVAEADLGTALAAWRSESIAKLSPQLSSELESYAAGASDGSSLRALVVACRGSQMGPLPAEMEAAVARAEAALQAARDKGADEAEAARVRSLGDAELLAFVCEVRELRRKCGVGDAAASQAAAALAADSAKAPATAEAMRKSVRQTLKAQFKFDKGLTRGKDRNMRASQPNVSQAVWDLLFPEAAGAQSCEIGSPCATFGVAYSYFRRQMRYGSDMVVKSMEASLSKQGVLSVKGKYGMGF